MRDVFVFLTKDAVAAYVVGFGQLFLLFWGIKEMKQSNHHRNEANRIMIRRHARCARR